MSDWGPVVIAVVLFVLLSPGLLFQLPGRSRVVEFGNMQTSALSILVHTIIFFGLITIFLIAIEYGTNDMREVVSTLVFECLRVMLDALVAGHRGEDGGRWPHLLLSLEPVWCPSNVVSYTTLIAFMAKSQNVDEALQLAQRDICSNL
ncbi:hypothetical protein H0E87_006274 [Populus deltoides]|uniref:Transmembrane protein n=1 Tax=Populus deltoides TaxID=3696 RepID=A0A8T2Z6F4_POPDE|nr:hypothetical protein H0E87_006274 [Populus deltoides]